MAQMEWNKNTVFGTSAIKLTVHIRYAKELSKLSGCRRYQRHYQIIKIIKMLQH